MDFGPGPGGRPSASCPVCKALERHRFLAYLLLGMRDRLPLGPVLDVAPQAQLRRILTALPGLHPYVGMDRYEPERHIDLIGDLTASPFRTSSFALVVCYHVLEHVPDDRAAMSEVARVMSPDGIAFIQVPHRPTAATDEDPTAGPQERIRRFGQADHVRYYGRDFEERLEDSGLLCSTITPSEALHEQHLETMGLQPDETVWIAGKGDKEHHLSPILRLSDSATVRERAQALDARTHPLHDSFIAALKRLRRAMTRWP